MQLDVQQTRSTIVGWQKVAFEAAHQRQHQLRLLARHGRRDAAGQRGEAHAESERGAAHEHQLGDASDHLLVAQHVGAADIQGAGDSGIRRRREHLCDVARVDRPGAVMAPSGQREDWHALDEMHEQAKGA